MVWMAISPVEASEEIKITAVTYDKSSARRQFFDLTVKPGEIDRPDGLAACRFRFRQRALPENPHLAL